MKFLLVGDVHWSQYSSILRSNGEEFSSRLEHLIKTVNYAERLAETRNADKIVYLGDFFDRSDINAEELCALSMIEWGRTDRIFLLGNHEISGKHSSVSVFNLLDRTRVISEPKTKILPDGSVVHFLPYISEDSRLGISEYLKNTKCPNKPIILSHNDISGIQMGKFISKSGFSVEEILENSSLFINGHLHNGTEVVSNRIVNIGNITGQNFSEDAFIYPHRFILLDTVSLEYEYIDNPYALKFYKIDFAGGLTNNGIRDIVSTVGDKSVISLQVRENEFENEVQEILSKSLCCRVTKVADKKDSSSIEKTVSIDHIKDFNEFIIEQCKDMPYIEEELQEIST